MRNMVWWVGAGALALLPACGKDGRCGGRDCTQSIGSASLTGSSGITTATNGGSHTSVGTSATSGGSGGTGGGFKFDLDPGLYDFGSDEGPIIPETCDQASSGESTVGCRFYAVDMDSHDSEEDLQYAIAVANVQLSGMATVTIETNDGSGWNAVAGPQVIPSLQLYTFNLPGRNTDDTQLRTGGSYRVSSDIPVVAYQFNPVDGSTSFLSDASMLIRPRPSTPSTTWSRGRRWSTIPGFTAQLHHDVARGRHEVR